MQAAVLHGIRDLRLESLPVPVPGPGEVLLRIASVGVCGSDVHYYVDGRIGDAVVTDPIIMGHEFSAVVAELGPGVSGLEVGRLVAVEPAIPCGRCEMCETGHPNLCPHVRFCGTPPIDGVYCEYAVMPAPNCFPMPNGFGAVDGAMLEPLGVAIHSVDLSHIRAGQTVAVLGAGPIGLLIAAVARAAGAAQILMTEPLDYRRAFALDYVADEVFDPRNEDVVSAVLDATNGRGVDIAFEAAGALETPEQGAEMLRPGGTLVLCGIPGPEDRLVLTASVVRRKGLTIKLVRRMKHTYPRAFRLVQSGMVDVRALATHLIPLSRIAEAFEMVANYRDGVIRAVIQVNEV
ncbi:MAG: alcohol dehydrogenase [Caldilineae bacterium]|nr:MAG: alcohol dehydrogenase [Caldilineae bacterium]